MRSRFLFALLTAIAFNLPHAFGGPRLIAPSDPSGTEIRDAAYQFFVCISNGDAAGAKAKFGGPADHERLMEAQLGVVKAGDDLRAALLKRFGKNDQFEVFSWRPLFQKFAQGQLKSLMIVNGDDACIAGGIQINLGLDLHRDGGQWKVVHLSNHYNATAQPIQLYTSLSQILRDVRTKVEAGGFATALDALNESGSKAKELLDDWSLRDFTKGTGPLGTATTSPVEKSAQLRELIGKSMGSPEVMQAIASLPNVPRITSFPRAFTLCSYETGIELSFSLPLGTLDGIDFYGEGVDGFHRFTGELPYGLSLGESRINVERKIGQPLNINGGPKSAITAEYSHIGIGVHYARPGGRDPQNPLTVVTILQAATGPAPATRPAGAPPRLQIRRVVTALDAFAGDTDPVRDPTDPAGRTAMLVSREIIFDESSVEDVNIYQAQPDNPSKFNLVLSLNAAAGERLKRVTSSHLGERLAFMFDGRVLIAPKIAGPVSETVAIKVELDQAGELAQQIRNAAYALPASK